MLHSLQALSQHSCRCSFHNEMGSRVSCLHVLMAQPRVAPPGMIKPAVALQPGPRNMHSKMRGMGGVHATG